MVVGVGIGGTFEKCALMAKHALTRDLSEEAPVPYVRELEKEMLERINGLGIGPGGLGGRITAFAVNIETYPTHIAGPVSYTHLDVYKRQPLKIVGSCGAEEHGTQVTFLPDKEIFEETVYDFDTLKIRLRETAFLTKGLKITLRDGREEKKEKTFHYEGGIREFVEYLNRSNVPLYEQVFYCEGQRDGVLVEVAMQHNDSYTENIYSFVNNINTPEGGTHLTGFKNALTKTFNDYGRKNKLLKENEPALSGEDIPVSYTHLGYPGPA